MPSVLIRSRQGRLPSSLSLTPLAPAGKNSPAIPNSLSGILPEAPLPSANPPAPRIFSVPHQNKTHAARPPNPNRLLQVLPAIPTENPDEKPLRSPTAVPFPHQERLPRPGHAREQKKF